MRWCRFVPWKGHLRNGLVGLYLLCTLPRVRVRVCACARDVLLLLPFLAVLACLCRRLVACAWRGLSRLLCSCLFCLLISFLSAIALIHQLALRQCVCVYVCAVSKQRELIHTRHTHGRVKLFSSTVGLLSCPREVMLWEDGRQSLQRALGRLGLWPHYSKFPEISLGVEMIALSATSSSCVLSRER